MTRHIITAGITAGFLLAATGCASNQSAPSTSSSAVSATYLFTGTLGVQGSSPYELIVGQASNVTIMLASLAAGPLGTPVPATVGLALGTPSEGTEGCPRTIDRRVAPALTSQLRTERTAGTHCLEIYDVGNLTGEAAFAVRIVVTPVSNTATPTAAPGTITFASILPMQGSATRALIASQSGQLTANLTTASPPGVVVGLGIGIPRADAAGCHLSTAVNTLTSAAAQVAGAVDAGEYCVKIYDPGTLTSNVTFTVAAAHP